MLLAASCAGDDAGDPADDARDAAAQPIVYEASDGENTNVYAVEPATGEVRQLTQRPGYNANPAWSPAGDRIVFVSRRDGEMRDVFVMDQDGTNVTQLTDTPDADEIAPKYSPDGATIAYARSDDDGWSLWLMSVDGSSPRKLAGPYRFVEFPSWAPDGRQIYFSAIEGNRAADILSVDLATLEVRVRIATEASDVCPHFSHDGKWLTYATESEEGNVDVFRHDVVSDDVTGSADVRLTTEAGVDDYANFSADDGQLVFVTRRSGDNDLWLMNPDGSGQRPLTSTPDLRENVPDW